MRKKTLAHVIEFLRCSTWSAPHFREKNRAYKGLHKRRNGWVVPTGSAHGPKTKFVKNFDDAILSYNAADHEEDVSEEDDQEALAEQWLHHSETEATDVRTGEPEMAEANIASFGEAMCTAMGDSFVLSR